MVKHNSIIVFLTLVAQQSLELELTDIETTFLHKELEKKIYMQQLYKGLYRKGKGEPVHMHAYHYIA